METDLRLYPESTFGGFTDVDGTIAFYNRVRSLLDPAGTLLDVGCGRGSLAQDKVPYRKSLRTLKGSCSRVVGIDVDPQARSNPFVDEFRPISDRNWPVDDATIQLCLCDFVLEHVDDPDHFFAEIRRVLCPGGYVCIRTPNASSYFGILSKIIPNRLHAHVAHRVQDRDEQDVFPTRYRCNTARRLRNALQENDFRHCVYGYEAEPSYFKFSALLYRVASWHQRHAPKAIRVTLFAFGEKRAD